MVNSNGSLSMRLWCMFVLACALPLWANPIPQQVLRKLDDQSFAAFTHITGPHLDVRVDRAQDLNPALRTYTGKLSGRFSYRSLGITQKNNRRALVPYAALSPPFKKAWIDAMWPKDRLQGEMWVHRVTYSGHETLWTLAQIFTESGQNYRAIKRASGLRGDRIFKGSRLKIPKQLLRAGLVPPALQDLPKLRDPVVADTTPLVDEVEVTGQQDPVAMEAEPSQPPVEARVQEPTSDGMVEADEASEPAQTGTGDDRADLLAMLTQNRDLQSLRDDLRFGTDAKGRYAEYRLKRGEAIYSAVVVKYCGLVRAEDVNRVAQVIIERNGIRDETDLPINMPIRIPYDYLEAEFKALDDPELLAYLRNMKEVSEVETAVVSRNLDGVHLILDSGHGGRDPGTVYGNSVWEDDYVYDIVCRIRERLLRESGAQVHFTVIDPSVQYKVQNVSRFVRDTDEFLMTSPSFPLSSSRATTAGVNLRWMKANYIYENLLKQGVESENIIFTSFHADSLHPSIRGSMVYVPDARIYPRRLPNLTSLRQYKEYDIDRSGFTRGHMRQSQARSMNLAQNYVAKIKARNMRVHKQKPIRTLIYRNPNRPFVPAVVKYNRIPTRALLEVCNLNNSHDREQMRKHSFRQAIADAYVEAVYETYGITAQRMRSNTSGSRAGK